MLTGPQKTLRKARQLRKQMSLPEILLWQQLRKRPMGFKFRRQQIAGDYILDFFCSAARLVIEVDGEAHERGDRPMRDGMRDEWLTAQGVRTLRIPAREILVDVEPVVRLIVERCRE